VVIISSSWGTRSAPTARWCWHAISRYYADAQNNFFLEAWYAGDYRQVDFARFVSLWEMDFERLKQVPGIETYLR